MEIALDAGTLVWLYVTLREIRLIPSLLEACSSMCLRPLCLWHLCRSLIEAVNDPFALGYFALATIPMQTHPPNRQDRVSHFGKGWTKKGAVNLFGGWYSLVVWFSPVCRSFLSTSSHTYDGEMLSVLFESQGTVVGDRDSHKRSSLQPCTSKWEI